MGKNQDILPHIREAVKDLLNEDIVPRLSKLGKKSFQN